MVHPILDERARLEVDVDEVMPQNNGRKLGRSRVLRKREASQPTKEKRSLTLKCGVCKSLGHNMRSCPKVPQSEKRKKLDHFDVFIYIFIVLI